MLTDFVTNKDSLELSYVNDKGIIEFVKMPIKSGYFDIDVAEEYEVEGNPNIIPNLVSYKAKKPLKFVPSNRFNHQSKQFFIDRLLPNYSKELYDNVTALRIPKLFSVDIEIEITDKYGYSTAEKAENRILWITVTSEEYNTLGYALNTDIFRPFIDPKTKRIHEKYVNVLRTKLLEIYKDSSYLNKLKDAIYDVVFFDTEEEMLTAYLNDVRLYYTCQIGHNFLGYDQTYIQNRCALLNIPLTISSPTNKVKKVKFGVEVNKGGKKEKPEVSVPRHRIILDNLWIFKFSLSYNNLETYKLDDLGELVVKSGKVSFEGNLRKLYEETPLDFMLYAFVDTILVMMIQQTTQLYQVDFYETYLNKVPFLELSQNAIGESLVYYNLKKDNEFLPISEYNISEKIEFEGAYVKKPTNKMVESVLGLDYSGLYVTLIIVLGISPEAKVDKINVDKYGYPLTDNDLKIWESWKSKGWFILSPKGFIYDNRVEPLFVKIENETRDKRAIFKNYSNKIYMELETKIENRIKELEALEA